MTVKRYYAHKHSINEDKVHDKICHQFMNITETVEHMNMYYQKYTALKQENEQLKQDNNALIHLLENQSIIIQELHSKLLEYQIKEPIVLKKEDLELMERAISYYTHGRYAE